MDKELEIAARYALHPDGYERFMANDLCLMEWVLIFEALLHSGYDIADQREADRLREHYDEVFYAVKNLEDYLEWCDAVDAGNPGRNARTEHLAMIDSIKRELAKL